MFQPDFYVASKCSIVEEEPQLKGRTKRHGKTPDSFASSGWIAILIGSTVFLCLAATFLHGRVVKTRQHKHHGEVAIANDFITGDDFHACNAASPGRELSGMMPDSVLTEPCSEADATKIAIALRSAGYKFESIIPQPYIFPAYLQQVLWMLNGKSLTSALTHLLAHAPAGTLGTLVKMFAWGMPVRMHELEASVETPIVDSLRNCGLVSRCTNLKDMVISSAMLFPIPNTSLLVATDWPSRSTVGMQEDVVPIVDLEGMALVFNSPPAKGLRVLDYSSGSGLQGLMAAHRSASEVTMVYTNTRATRFIRFSAWMNKLSINLYRSSDQLQGQYDLMLAQPPFLPIPSALAGAKYKRNGGKDGTEALRDVLTIASKVLSSSGILALLSEFNTESIISPNERDICHLGLKGFSGSAVLRSHSLQPDAYALAHADVAPVRDQVQNMLSEHISGVSSGFIFAKRQPADVLDGSGCGVFSIQLLMDPLQWPTSSTSKFDRSCYLSEETDCPDIPIDS